MAMTTTIYSVDEARRRARRLLPKVVFDFIEGGADDELTTKANRRAFDRILFRPLTGVDVGEPDLRTTVLDTELSFPVLLAPCGGLSMFHPDGQAGAARAAASAHTIAVVGTLSGSLLEKGMSDGGGAPHWFQLYKLGGRAGWHQSQALGVPANITVDWLPAYSPQGNPQERVWREVRRQPFGNHD